MDAIRLKDRLLDENRRLRKKLKKYQFIDKIMQMKWYKRIYYLIFKRNEND